MPEWRNWYTRTTQNRVPQGLRVQVPPPAPNYKPLAGAFCLAGDLNSLCFKLPVANQKNSLSKMSFGSWSCELAEDDSTTLIF